MGGLRCQEVFLVTVRGRPDTKANTKLIEARLRTTSPTGSGGPMPRQELAEAVNAWQWEHEEVRDHLDENTIGTYERGEYRWPRQRRRDGLRAVLGVRTDADLGFYPNRRQRSLSATTIAPHPFELGGQQEMPGGDINRRRALQLSAPIAAVALHRQGTGPARLITALMSPAGRLPDDLPTGYGPLESTLKQVRHDYQHSRYRAALDRLPGLMVAVERPDADHLNAVHGLRAAAYQVASGLLLKLDDIALAAVAADRSMTAARTSGDPLTIASSTRCLVHTLMASGHLVEATSLAISAAEQFDRDDRGTSVDHCSIYGALLLRASLAAARREDADTARALLDEAAITARRVGDETNAAWTAFGPTNVVLHRVAVAVALGDAGTAVRLAATVSLDRLPIPERKAMLLLDTAKALTQWGKYEKALNAIRSAEQFAPEEVRSRTSVHQLLADLDRRCPPPFQRHVREYVHGIGVTI
jgi:hypothetical protein